MFPAACCFLCIDMWVLDLCALLPEGSRKLSESESVSFSLLRAAVCCGKWHSNLHLIATLGTSLIAPESAFSAMLSAVRKSPTAISTQVMSSYCPIYPLTLTKGCWGHEDRHAVKDSERQTQAVLFFKLSPQSAARLLSMSDYYACRWLYMCPFVSWLAC